MSKMVEYATTSAEWYEGERASYLSDEPGDACIPNPEPPDDGRTWRLVSSAATEGRLFWFWERVS